ncbi:phosphopantetheine adenylyltransferase [Spiroplasma sabaudiense Ar-1343]|uniref:Phosphopantetheine adenylyltransferase n=1 Tax=Spiroplasma sabaudiense Ar-1343 TaxID=1276257 RepID=W6AB81_9MOLU|nr:pantetheine-phosphate adenylyltransferase [Spiroplasma sabaudiense]AHI54115.1 phosphopantetheine adenylyltransferase [Spiroplasma sabaudiense Ar-1343]
MIGMYPGSFDPFHEGHLQIIQKAAKLFEKVLVVVTKNISKNPRKSFEHRIIKIKAATKDLNNVEILINENQLTADFAKSYNANFLIRGIRNSDDMDYEIKLADGNKLIEPDLDTVFFISDLPLRKVSSSILEEIEIYQKNHREGKNVHNKSDRKIIKK